MIRDYDGPELPRDGSAASIGALLCFACASTSIATIGYLIGRYFS